MLQFSLKSRQILSNSIIDHLDLARLLADWLFFNGGLWAMSRLCLKGCGCRCPEGFKTCCRGCAKTGIHNSKCLGPPEATDEPFDPFSTDDANPEMTLPAWDSVPTWPAARKVEQSRGAAREVGHAL